MESKKMIESLKKRIRLLETKIEKLSDERTGDLKISEEKFRLLFNKSHDPILIIDGYDFVECNNAAVKILGYKSKKDIFKVHPSVLSPEYQPDGRLSHDKAQEMIDIAFTKGYHRFEWVHVDRLEKEMFMDVALTKIPYKGKNMIFTIWRDISKQKENERKILERERQYTSLFEQAADGILVGIPGGEITGANQSILKLTAYDKNELVGNNISILFEEEQLITAPLRYDLVKKGDTVIRERNIIRKDGKRVAVEMNTKILSDGRMQALFRDVSKRKQIEIALKESEEKYRSIFLNSPLGILHYDAQGIITDCNDHFVDIIGSNKQSLVGLNMIKSLKNKKLIIAVRKSIESGEGYFEDWYDSITASKTTYVRILFKSIRDKNNAVISGIGLVEDISERKKAENELKERTNFLDKIIESSAISMWISDHKGTAIRTNPACLKFFGATEEEVVGKYNLFNDSVIEKAGLMPKIKKVFDHGEVANIIIDYNFGDVDHINVKNAAHKIVNSILTPVFDRKGRLTNVIAQAIDLTEIKRAESEIKKSEEKFRLLFENSNDAIIITDSKSTVDCNSSSIKMFGCSNKEDILSRSAIDFSPEFQPDGTRSKEAIQTILSTLKQGEVKSFDWVHSRIDGTNFYAEVSLIPFAIHGNYYLQSIVRDISERKEIEQRIYNVITETEEKERQRLASDIHDEIGPLLSSMKMYIDSLKNSSEKEKQEFVQKKLKSLILESIENVREVSNALSPYLLNKYGLFTAIDSYTISLKDLITINFESNLEKLRFESKHEIVFFRIIKELINNTIKHANANNIHIKLEFIEKNLILKYSDNGIGIQNEILHKLEIKGMGLFNIINRIKSVNGSYKFNTNRSNGFCLECVVNIN